ncbi:helix-turn-helix domain-containing protein [Compostimonas suwonensis]|uniref:HTH-type transcriptional regulator RipA n=1 Tax=Compostimonas suwonensis TaxID=1048394 RepID=A0A2M9BWP4_9MICO|nr:AraC family transcriptional regulator [Compostimonas suwonensis]PJJ62373.1 AraC-like DNA-binding protein [Compostimonas suwonensis]
MTSRIRSREIDTARDARDGDRWEPHVHDEHELLWASTDRITVITPEAVHLVPPGASVWIPAGVVHEVHVPPGNRMHCTWFAAARPPGGLTRTAVLVTPPLLAHVLNHVMTTSLAADERDRAESFALDVLAHSPEVAVDIPQPTTAWLTHVVAALVADPSDKRSIRQWAAECNVGLRTFSRHFQAETGMSFSRWRAELRHRTAMQLLASGAGVRGVAHAVGFDSVSSFTTAFRKQTGTTPAAFARHTELPTPVVMAD